MPDPETLIREYLGAPLDGLWQWAEDGEVVVWTDGKTIAYREELHQILEHVAPEGLMSFTSVLLVMTACRQGWDETNSVRHLIHRIASPIFNAGRSTPGLDSRWLDDCLSALDRIHALPEALRTGPWRKAMLVMQVLGGTPSDYPPAEAACIVEMLGHPLPESALTNQRDRKQVVCQLLADADLIRKRVDRLDEATLRMRAETGLEHDIRPADIDLPLSERTLCLLEDLATDGEHQSLARLARQLMAAVHLPRPVSQEEDLPLGGFSDIANKGPLDRLLVSELAHDDLTLVTRVALNEALYLRREAPPQHLLRSCRIFIDCGIRMWGVTRVYAAATGLALAATADRQWELAFYFLGPSGLVNRSLATREGLMALLANLDPTPQPAEALDALCMQMDTPTDEVLLITHQDVLDDPEFIRARIRSPLDHLFVVALSADGKFQLLSASPSGYRRLREAWLDLDHILQEESLLSGADHEHLPAFLRRGRLSPLRMAYPAPSEDVPIALKAHGIFFVLGDGRLMLCDHPGLGARLITDRLPRGRHFITVIEAEESVHVITVCRAKNSLVLTSYFPLDDRLTETAAPLPGNQLILNADLHGDSIHVVTRLGVYLYDRASGALQHHLDGYAPLEWVRGRFFREGTQWHQLTRSSGGLALVPVVPPHHLKRERLRTVFDRVGFDEPWAVTANGHVVSFGDPALSIRKVPDREPPTGVSRDGRHVLYSDGRSLQLDTGKWSTCVHVANRFVSENEWVRSLLTPRTKFRGVHVEEDGTLVLIKGARAFRMVAKHGLPVLGFAQIDMSSDCELRIQEFSATVSPDDVQYHLRVARFGRRLYVFLDSRGLLHLKSGHPEDAEITLALADRGIGGWCSDGTLCGGSFFVGHGQALGAEEFLAKIRLLTRRAHDLEDD